MRVTRRNKLVKKILGIKFGYENVSVKGGTGTAYGWCDIIITVDDPCPHKQDESPCSSFCLSGICDGNLKLLRGGWGNSARQLKNERIVDQAREALKDIEFDSYYADDGYNTQSSRRSIEVKFRR